MNDLFAQRLRSLEGNIAVLSRRAHNARGGGATPALREALASLRASVDCLRAEYDDLERSRAAAEQEHRRYRELVCLAPDGYIVSDEHGVIIEVNCAASRLLGRDVDALPHTSLADLIRAGDRGHFRERLMRAASGEEKEFTTHMLGATTFVASLRVAPERAAEGNIVALRWLIRDVTRERQAQDLRSLHVLESFGEGFYALDQDWRFIYLNRRAEALFGVPRDELTGRIIWDAGEAAPQGEARDAHLGARTRGEATELDHFAPALQRWLRFTISPVDDRLYVCVQDIAQRKLAEEAVRKQELDERQLLEALPAGAWETDAFGNTRFVNRYWLQYTGLLPEETQGRGWVRAIHADDLPAIFAQGAAANSRRPPASWQAQFRVRRRDGVFRWHLAEMQPLVEEDGSLTGWISVAVEVHDMKEGERQVQHLYEEARSASAQLQHANESKDEFLGFISHELKTPITTIIGNAEVLLKHARQLDDDRRATALEDIQTEAGRLHQIVEELLSLSRIERGQEVELEPLLLGHLIERIIAEHRVRYPERAFEVDVRTDTPALGEPLYVEQVVRNFLSNAEKYSPRDSAITASVRLLRDEVEVAISDRGSGLSDEEVMRVFEPFERLERTALQASGAGIGLAVCKRLIEAQSGRIWARRHEGGGSEFGFALRAVQDDLGREP
jgi:PAS domain S-box-containing protein